MVIEDGAFDEDGLVDELEALPPEPHADAIIGIIAAAATVFNVRLLESKMDFKISPNLSGANVPNR